MPKLSIITFSTIAVLMSSLLISSTFIYLNYQNRLEYATTQALNNHQQALKDVLTRIRSDYSNEHKVINSLIYRYQAKQALLKEFPSLLLRELSMFLHSDEHADAIMIVTADNTLWALHQIKSAEKKGLFGAPHNAYFLLQKINDNKEVRYFYDQALTLIEKQALPATLNIEERPWYQQAKTAHKVTVVEPYLDNFRNEKVFSMVKQVNQLTVNLALNSQALSESMRHDALKFNTWLFLINSQNKLLALQDGQNIQLSNQQIAPWQMWLAHSAAQVRSSDSHSLTKIQTKNQSWYISASEINNEEGSNIMLVAATEAEDILAPIYAQLYQWLFISIGLCLLELPLSYFVAHLMTRPIRQVNKYASQLANFEAPKKSTRYAQVAEIEELAHSLELLHSNLVEFFSLLETLSKEQNLQHLIDKIAIKSMQMMHADGCLILLTKSQTLVAEFLQYHKQKFTLDNLPTIDWHALYTSCDTTKINQLPKTLQTLFSQADSECYQVLVPLKNRKQQVIGLQIYFYPVRMPQEHISLKLAEQVAAFFGVAIEGRKLVNRQEKLLDSFIQVITGAIDTKSHYTGKHCQRVPELATQIAEAASQSTQFPDFHFDESARRQLSIAAWLHDCGKVTTPEYIVDKATRLETIYNRIHEIRTRFEVVKRDLEIDALKEILAGADKSEVNAKLIKQIKQLESDFAHVAYCNSAEFVSDSDKNKLHEIAQLNWQPYFNERLGLSQEELTQYTDYPEVSELSILTDKPSHLLYNQNLRCDSTKYNLQQPELRNNLGELYNLSVSAGTINSEERYAINHHIIQTIEILEKLPFPKHLSRVPEIAGAHHEKLNGNGYPKGLFGEQISFEARILAIADIFEALTASDRPYKKAKTLPQAIGIMQQLASKGELDQDLLNFFIAEKIPEHYGRVHLKAEQLN
jgi:HD-GYP domain-containing protein (c-di-GMP phosphodiesterase class II)